MGQPRTVLDSVTGSGDDYIEVHDDDVIIKDCHNVDVTFTSGTEGGQMYGCTNSSVTDNGNNPDAT